MQTCCISLQCTRVNGNLTSLTLFAWGQVPKPESKKNSQATSIFRKKSAMAGHIYLSWQVYLNIIKLLDEIRDLPWRLSLWVISAFQFICWKPENEFLKYVKISFRTRELANYATCRMLIRWPVFWQLYTHIFVFNGKVLEPLMKQLFRRNSLRHMSSQCSLMSMSGQPKKTMLYISAIHAHFSKYCL